MNFDTRPHIMAVVDRLDAVYGALSCEPDITPNLGLLRLENLPVVILALLNRGVRDVNAIFDYVCDRGAVVDMEDILQILHDYRTTARFPEGGFNGLWRSSDGRSWTPNITVGSY